MLELKEKLTEAIVSVTVTGLKRLSSKLSFVATVSLKDTGAWQKEFDEDGNSFLAPVESMEVGVEYISPRDCPQYSGFYGWIGKMPMLALNNDSIGCLGRDLPVADWLLEALRPWDRKRRQSCEGGPRLFVVPVERMGAAIDQLSGVEGMTFQHCSLNDKVAWLEYVQAPCKNVQKCDTFRKTVYYPPIHIPFPNQAPEEASTTLTRFVMGATAGCVARVVDPTYCGGGNFWHKRGRAHPYPVCKERFPSCRTCLYYKHVVRGNELLEDGSAPPMGQAGLSTIAKDGVEPIEWCRFHRRWIEAPWEARQEMMQKSISPTSSLGSWMLSEASKRAACDTYQWRQWFSTDKKSNYRQTGVFRQWTPAVRGVYEEDTLVIARAPFVSVSYEVKDPQLIAYRNRFK